MMLTEASACIWFNRGHLAPCVLTRAIDFKNKSISILHFESIAPHYKMMLKKMYSRQFRSRPVSLMLSGTRMK